MVVKGDLVEQFSTPMRAVPFFYDVLSIASSWCTEVTLGDILVSYQRLSMWYSSLVHHTTRFHSSVGSTYVCFGFQRDIFVASAVRAADARSEGSAPGSRRWLLWA